MKPWDNFQLSGRSIRYGDFVPRLYNWCISLGLEPGKTMPSRAFCSDENQGYAVALIAKHFGTFPFNHGRVGGIVATDRHGPHAHHGRDLAIIQASHVGYSPESARFGDYRRPRTAGNETSSDCGKIAHVLAWYQEQYAHAAANVFLVRERGALLVRIDDQYLDSTRDEGLFLNLDRLVQGAADRSLAAAGEATAGQVFRAADSLAAAVDRRLADADGEVPLGSSLSADLFEFRKATSAAIEGPDHVENNLKEHMPLIVTSPSPRLAAAQVNTQAEFERTLRTLEQEPAYQGKRLLFVSGVNVDISSDSDPVFPQTYFVPWAAAHLQPDGEHEVYQQARLYEELSSQPTESPDQVQLDRAIDHTRAMPEIEIEFPLSRAEG